MLKVVNEIFFLKRLLQSLLVFALTTSAFAASNEGEPNAKRRQFLMVLAGVGVGVVTNTLGGYTLDQLLKPDVSERQYTRTSIEQHLTTIGIVILTEVMQKFSGQEMGNGGATKEYMETMLKTQPVKMWIRMVVAAPVLEEIIFRFAPSQIFGTNWVVGGISTYIFGVMHNMGADKAKIPLPQWILGAYFWHLTKNYGVTHAMLAHAVNNNFAFFGSKAAYSNVISALGLVGEMENYLSPKPLICQEVFGH